VSRLRRALRAEEGTTLAEVMAGMAVMGVFLTIFAGTMLSIYRTTSKVEAVTITSSRTNTAFLRLDKIVRYASAISTPTPSANSNGNYYVEVQTANTGTTVCTQLQLSTGTGLLRARTWTVPGPGTYSGLSGFAVLATGLGASGTPFTLAPTGAVAFEQLTVTLAATSGTSASATSTIANTFTALNSSASSKAAATDPTSPNSVCQEVGRP